MKIGWDTEAISVEWGDGALTRFPSVWLRDQCAFDRDPGTGQRLVDIADLPEAPRIVHAIAENAAITVLWEDDARPAVFSAEWLRTVGHPAERRVSLWTARDAGRLTWSDYAGVAGNDSARREWLAGLVRDGVAFLTGVQLVEGEVGKAARLFGYITETNYGRIFDVRTVSKPNNLAYTPLGLGVHTDNPYREPVPGYQLLHCLEPSEDGGASIFVDGFAVAAKLREVDPGAFAALTTIPVDFAFRDAETELSARRTLIRLDPAGEVVAIHYNNRSVSTAAVPLAASEAFFDAYRKFAELLRSSEFEFRVTLKAGDLVAFDNRRLLHGRTAFRGSRLLQGCYVAPDGVASTLAVLSRRL